MTTEDKKTELKKEENKVEEKKVIENKKPEIKDKAIVRGLNLAISPKYSGFVCRVIRGRNPEWAIKRLEDVLKMKRAIPMASLEVPHRKGMAGGRYPLSSCTEIIKLLKQVSANASVAGIENPIITIAKADKSQGPYKRGGVRAKRAHIYIEVRDKSKLKMEKKK